MSRRRREVRLGKLEEALKRMTSESPITPQIFLEAIVPVARGARPASMVFLDQFNLKKMGTPVSPDHRQNSWYKSVKTAARDYAGLHTDLLIDLSSALRDIKTVVFPRVIFYKKRKIREKLDRLKEKHAAFLSKLRFGMLDREALFQELEQEGKLLAIPSCCIDRFVKNRREFYGGRQFHAPEYILKESLRKLAPNLDDIPNLPVDQLAVFWAYEVYPCKLDCQQARMKGYEILGCFGDNRFAEAYKEVVMVNNAKALHTREAVIKIPTRLPSDEDRYEVFNQGILDYLRGNDTKSRGKE